MRFFDVNFRPMSTEIMSIYAWVWHFRYILCLNNVIELKIFHMFIHEKIYKSSEKGKL